MYSGGFCASVSINGVSVQENGAGEVHIPFGTEYDIELRGPNNGRRSVAWVYIDGVCVTPDGFVVQAYGSTYLNRPTKGSDKRFKFASIDSVDADSAGKGGPNTDGKKGVIRVEFKSEKVQAPPVTSYPRPLRGPTRGIGLSDHLERAVPAYGGNEDACHSFAPRVRSLGPSPAAEMRYPFPSFASPPEPVSDGVTVGGSKSDQTFINVNIEVEEGPPVVVQLKLKGYVPRQTYQTHPPQRYCQYCNVALSDPLSNRCPCCGQIAR